MQFKVSVFVRLFTRWRTAAICRVLSGTKAVVFSLKLKADRKICRFFSAVCGSKCHRFHTLPRSKLKKLKFRTIKIFGSLKAKVETMKTHSFRPTRAFAKIVGGSFSIRATGVSVILLSTARIAELVSRLSKSFLTTARTRRGLLTSIHFERRYAPRMTAGTLG